MKRNIFFRKLISVLFICTLVFQNIAYWIIIRDEWIVVAPRNTVSQRSVLDHYRYIFQQVNKGSTDKIFENKESLELFSTDYKSRYWYNLDFPTSINYDIKEWKALYDTSIAIVDSKDTQRLSYETPYYCDLIISSLAKYKKIWGNHCLPSYQDFINSYSDDPDRTYVTVIDDYDIKNADLSKFGIIIFPDILLWKHPFILNNIWALWIEKVKNYVNDWWITFFSSKSIVLAEKMEIIWDVVDDDILLKHHTNQWKIKIENNDDFNTKVLNYSIYNGKNYTQASKNNEDFYDYLLWSYLINDDWSLTKARYFDLENDSNYYFQDVQSLEDIEIESKEVISSFYKKTGKWLVLYNGWNSLFSSWNSSHVLFTNHVLNSILLSFLREVYTQAEVSQKSNPLLNKNLVPALEKNILFEYDFKWVNVFKNSVTELKNEIYYSTWLIASNIPTECTDNSITRKIICLKDNLESWNEWNINFNLEIIDPTFSQRWRKIEVTDTIFTYTNSNSKNIIQNIWNQTIDALWTAKMRWELNVDPSSYYPLKWEWVFIDEVVVADNKSETESLDVSYTTIVPLISPLFDEIDQEKLSLKLEFPKNYYNDLYNDSTKTWMYPFNQWDINCNVWDLDLELDNRCKDFYIPELIKNKYNREVFKVDNYDEPVYRVKSDDWEAYAEINQTNTNLSDLGQNIEKQIFMPDAAKLLRHAKPRKMPFIYPVKKEVLFAHQDIYFYDNLSYVLPNWITDRQSFISIDKYSNDFWLFCDWDKNTISFNWIYSHPYWIIENEYSNYLKCNRWESKQISWDNLPPEIEQAYYLHPIHSKNEINSASDLSWFDSNWNFIGYSNNSNSRNLWKYPIKFVKWTYSNFYIPRKSSLKWWYFEFNLPGSVQEADIKKIYMLADHIAVTDIIRKWKNVKIYFYRWNMANEQNLKSEFWIWIEWVNIDMNDIDFNIYSLNYNLSQSEDKNQTYNYENTLKINFNKQNFFKLPAVKLKFELPRRKRITKNDIKDFGLTEGHISIIFSQVTWSDEVLVFRSLDRKEVEKKIDSSQTSKEVKIALLNIFDNVKTESYVRRWEHLEPFVRFWIYVQELLHRTVWWSAEIHTVVDPWAVVDSTIFTTILNVWTSPIPYREYLKTWETQIIPLWEESSRINYKDLFNRKFAQPVRTSIPEAVPLPPPLRDFVINTTYEMYDSSWDLKTRWDWEEELEIRQNIKLYNNYPKYFDPTVCKDNMDRNDKRYWECYDWVWTVKSSDNIWYKGNSDYKFKNTILNSTDFYYNSWTTLFNARSEYDNFMSELNNRIAQDKLSGITPNNFEIKYLNRIKNANLNLPSGNFINDEARNYSPEVENYYPEDYINNDMWNLTHYDYSDSPYNKWYPFHMDNLIPNAWLDDLIPKAWSDINQGHNILVVPFNKWIWYKTKYFKENKWYWWVVLQNKWKIEHNLTNYTSFKYAWRTGWWWENLQNRDDTTLAWNSKINKVPYSFNNVTKEYLNTPNIDSSYFESVPKSEINNIYSCLFNPKKIISSNSKYSYTPNIVENNIIPIFPWITKSDKQSNNSQAFLDNYSCSKNQYNTSDLNKINNISETENSYWLYFSSNLKWWSKEWLNLISRLQKYSPDEKDWYEWDVKVIEWWRFVYWNPANWPNSFLIVDNPTQIVKSVKSDLILDKEVMPYWVKNYDTDVYLLYNLKDETEEFIWTDWQIIPRRWNYEVYSDSKWFWNYSSTIYVWNAYNKIWVKNSLLNPWDNTVVKLELLNNSWFDWEMLWKWDVVLDNWQYITNISGWIDFKIMWNKALNAYDLLHKLTRNVLAPLKYNFINYDIPTEIIPYITIKPSLTDIETPWTFFDFDNVNVTTIRDGFKWTYFIDVKIDPNIPDNLRWKVFDIKVSLNPEYFNKLPWEIAKDPVWWPEKLLLPDIRFAVANSIWEAFYINGQSENINLDINLVKWYNIDKIYKLDEPALNKLRNSLWNATKKHQRLRETFESYNGVLDTIDYSLKSLQDKDSININLEKNWITKFPYFKDGLSWEVTSDSIDNNLMLLIHLTKDSLEEWEHVVEQDSKISFTDSSLKIKEKQSNLVFCWSKTIWEVKVFSQWPKLEINYSSSLIWNNKNQDLKIQKLINWENIIKSKIFLKNVGSDVAFNPVIKINIEPWITINKDFTNISWAPWAIEYNSNQIIVRNLYSESWSLNTVEWEAIWPWITNYIPVYLNYVWNIWEGSKQLIKSVEYEFTPFDQILEPMTWIFNEWLKLNYVNLDFDVKNNSLDKYVVTWSWNSLWVYWDFIVDQELKYDKNNEPDLFNVKTFNLDPLKDHNFVARAYFKSKDWSFKLIKEIIKNISWTNIIFENTDVTIIDSEKYNIWITTNKYWKYNWYYDYSLIQWWGLVINSWPKLQTTDNWKFNIIIPNIDTTLSWTIKLNLYESWSILKTINVSIFDQDAKIFDLGVSRTWNSWKNLKINFKTNKISNNCFKIYSVNKLEYLTNWCKKINKKELNFFTDTISDVHSEQEYNIEIFNENNLDQPTLSWNVFYLPDSLKKVWTPTKIFSIELDKKDINFEAVKDLKKDYYVDWTKIRYIVNIKKWSQLPDNFGQSNDDEKVKVYYSEWYLYAEDTWNKKLIKPIELINSEIPVKNKYSWYWYKLASNSSIITDNINTIEVSKVWKKPDIVVLNHSWEELTLPICMNWQKDMCYVYEINKIIIYTNKFSDIIIYNKTPVSSLWGWGYWPRIPICLNIQLICKKSSNSTTAYKYYKKPWVVCNWWNYNKSCNSKKVITTVIPTVPSEPVDNIDTNNIIVKQDALIQDKLRGKLLTKKIWNYRLYYIKDSLLLPKFEKLFKFVLASGFTKDKEKILIDELNKVVIYLAFYKEKWISETLKNNYKTSLVDSLKNFANNYKKFKNNSRKKVYNKVYNKVDNKDTKKVISKNTKFLDNNTNVNWMTLEERKEYIRNKIKKLKEWKKINSVEKKVKPESRIVEKIQEIKDKKLLNNPYLYKIWTHAIKLKADPYWKKDIALLVKWDIVEQTTSLHEKWFFKVKVIKSKNWYEWVEWYIFKKHLTK